MGAVRWMRCPDGEAVNVAHITAMRATYVDVATAGVVVHVVERGQVTLATFTDRTGDGWSRAHALLALIVDALGSGHEDVDVGPFAARVADAFDATTTSARPTTE